MFAFELYLIHLIPHSSTIASHFYPQYMLLTEMLEFCFIFIFFFHVPSVVTILNVSLEEKHFEIFNLDVISYIFYFYRDSTYNI